MRISLLVILAGALYAQPPTPFVEVDEPNYGAATGPFKREIAKVKVTVFPDGTPFALESTSIALPEPVVRALMKMRFQSTREPSLITLNFPVRDYSPPDPPALRRRLHEVAPDILARADHLKPKELEKLGSTPGPGEDPLEFHSLLLIFASRRDEANFKEMRVEHLLWLIEHHPDAEILRSNFGRLPRDAAGVAYTKASQLWLDTVAEDPTNLVILEAASLFLAPARPDLVAKILAPVLSGSRDAQLWLGEAYAFASLSMPDAPFAHTARDALAASSELPILTSAHHTLYAEALQLKSKNQPLTGFDALCTSIANRILQFDPKYPGTCQLPKKVGTVRPYSTVQMPTVKKKVEPKYSPEARAMRLEGELWFRVQVGTDGKGHDLKFIHGPFAHYEQSIAALQKWTFQPAVEFGVPVELAATIAMTFHIK